jgi:hypothetical protein
LSALHKQRQDQFEQFALETIRQLQGGSLAENLVQAAGLWPTTTAKTLLRRLSLKERPSTSPHWITCLRHLAELIIFTQQSRRLIDYALSKKGSEYRAELLDSRGRLASQDADWLLIEIDADISIRQEQVDVAESMITPASEENAVMQLNMGKGKSSVSDGLDRPSTSSDLSLHNR